MSSIRLQIFPSTYENDSAYEYVLSYIYNKYLTGGYGYYVNVKPLALAN